MTAPATSPKTIVKKHGLRALDNFLELITSKTTWMTVAGIAIDVSTTGGAMSVKSLGLIGLKIFQQAMADHGKNRK